MHCKARRKGCITDTENKFLALISSWCQIDTILDRSLLCRKVCYLSFCLFRFYNKIYVRLLDIENFEFEDANFNYGCA